MEGDQEENMGESRSVAVGGVQPRVPLPPLPSLPSLGVSSFLFGEERNVIVFANLKPRNMCGVKSFGILMAASDAAHENLELLVPPECAVPGERVWFGSLDEKENLHEVASLNQVQKKKIWEQVQPHLKTDESCVVTLGMQHPMRT
ncbi:hypothetical protein OROGR_008239 [Orobanche gracilis]